MQSPSSPIHLPRWRPIVVYSRYQHRCCARPQQPAPHRHPWPRPPLPPPWESPPSRAVLLVQALRVFLGGTHRILLGLHLGETRLHQLEFLLSAYDYQKAYLIDVDVVEGRRGVSLLGHGVCIDEGFVVLWSLDVTRLQPPRNLLARKLVVEFAMWFPRAATSGLLRE